MNASQAFRSHLMQQFAASARNQARTPIALIGWVDSSDDGLAGLPLATRPLSSIGITATPPVGTSLSPPSSQLLRHESSSASCRSEKTIVSPPHRFLSAFTTERKGGEVSKDTSTTLDRDDDTRASASKIPPMNLASSFQTLLQTRSTTSQFRNRASDALVNSFHNTDDAPPLLTAAEYKAAVYRAVIVGRAAPNHKRTEPFTLKRLLGPSPNTERLADIAGKVHFQLQSNKYLGASDDTLLAEAESKREKWSKIPAFLVTLVSSTRPSDVEKIEATTEGSKKEGDDDYIPLPYLPPETERELEDYAAACAATQNILLSLHAEGLASKWATGPVVRTPAFRKLIHAESSDRVVALIMIGQAAVQKHHRHRRYRRALHGDVLQDI